ncbi:SLC13 family permease [Salsipaludibacter albus]|uniref:SLC13 family permease n=1 Tax=Salsipaludibacter albus TaxID=2849650 RepID=UPI001EE3BF50|nr:SLC13 family permease [Salsipaludibacter albus]MBY5163428.1 SLC13 family permease [Salsipaludibacter albus]
MGTDAWITVAVLVVAFAALASDRLPPSAIVLAATVSLLLLDVITVDQALAGFSSPAPLTVAALYVVARAAQKTGLLAPVTAQLIGEGRRWTDLVRLVVPTAGVSSLLNNTPLVAMLVPDIVKACEQRRIAASRFLMPLSFAAILGGTLTVLGTSTNLVVSGLLQEVGEEPFGLFELTPVSGPTAVVGLAVMVVVAWWLVPVRVSAAGQATEDVREFVMAMEVVAGGPLDRARLGDTTLVGRRHVFVVQVTRGDTVIAPVDLDVVLAGGDRIAFAGQVEQVVDLYRVAGLRSSAGERVEEVARPGQRLHVAVVGRTSPAAGHTLEEVDFLARYQAAVLAVHRDGHRLTDEPRDVRLRAADTLILLADEDFPELWRERPDFLVIAPTGGDPPHAGRRAPLVAAITVAMVAIAAFGWLSILEAALLAAGALVATGTLSATDVREAIDLDVIVLIAASFGLGAALEVTGVADLLAGAIVGAFDGFGTAGIVFGLLLSVSLLTELVTNNAAVVVVFPIMTGIVGRTGLDLRTMAVGIAIAASASFMTPIGYQTNTIVYGPGGYRFTDYLRVGVPLNFAVVAMATAMIMVVAPA